MSSHMLLVSSPGVAGRLAVLRGQRNLIVVGERLRLAGPATAPARAGRRLATCRMPFGTCRVAELVGPSSEKRATEERFLDVHAFLSDFNPLKDSHLLKWEDSDDEDGAVQAELPQTSTWEDSASGYQGLEYQPSWIDYRDGSESDDPDTRRGVLGAYEALATVLPDLGHNTIDDALASSPLQAGGLQVSAAVPNAYSPEAGFQEISVVELEERLATGQFSLLLDVRAEQEYEWGHIAGAVNLPLDTELSAAVRSGSLEEFRDRAVAVYCGSGGRSDQATVRLTKVFGFSNVTSVKGGLRAWQDEGMPVEGNQLRSSCGCGGGGGGGGCKNGKQGI